jgi:hypothetical protein
MHVMPVSGRRWSGGQACLWAPTVVRLDAAAWQQPDPFSAPSSRATRMQEWNADIKLKACGQWLRSLTGVASVSVRRTLRAHLIDPSEWEYPT